MDYIFSNLYTYFNSGQYKLSWTSPQSWTTYVMTMGVMLWAMVVEFALDHCYFHSSTIYISVYTGLVFAAIVYYLLYLRYVQNDKYAKVVERNKNVNTAGLIVSMLVVVIAPLILIGFLCMVNNRR